MEKQIYHIFNRGVEKREVFLENSDRIRFIHDIYEFNDTNPALPFARRVEKTDKVNKEREKIVMVQAFCLMPNHYHLVCEEIEEMGTSLFMKKLQGGYARAFNEKYKRNGYLFQGRYKHILITTDRQLLQVVCYIHANPLELWKSNWKEKRLTKKDIDDALNFLQNYRWSSHLDYLGNKNFSSVVDREFIKGVFEEYGCYETFFKSWLEFFGRDSNEIKEHIFEE